MKNRKTLVMARNEKILKTGIKTSKGTLKFNRGASLYINDPGLAEEVEMTAGIKSKTKDVWTHEDERYEHASTYKEDGVHSYIFGTGKKFADAWDAFMARRKDKKAV